MHRSRRAAIALATICLAISLTSITAPAPATAAAACGTHASETTPPPTIRVYRTASGTVDVVNFRAYVKNVLSREWISSWTTESLRSGALAVKNYAWYQVLHWRGYVNAAGECFDVFDSTRDQHYDPSRPTYPAMAAAVDATWATLALKNGRIFATYYNAGAPNERCGANANGWQMFQWGTQACGLAGMSAARIMTTYYSGVSVVAAPPPAPPPPTPQPTPAPTPTPPTTPAPGTPGPSATPSPTPAATPAPTPTPPPSQAPGGGQDLTAPPPPPPPDPAPIVVTAPTEASPEPAVEAPEPRPTRARVPAAVDTGRLAMGPAELPGRATHGTSASVRWFALRVILGRLVEQLAGRWSAFAVLPAEQTSDDELRGGDVLDGQPDRLEDRDGIGRPRLDPAAIDAPDLDEVGFRD